MHPEDLQHPREAGPLLTLVACARNDQHEGDSVWRLETTLNFAAESVVRTIGLESVEIIVCDWGSRRPLRKAIDLTPEARRITRFLEVPPPVAEDRQGDSVFSEVHANNAAIRRAAGRFVGRIDQDTLVGPRFFARFHDLVAGDSSSSIDAGLLFVGRRSIPLSFTEQRPPRPEIRTYIETYGRVLPAEGIAQRPWYDAPVGIALMRRELWHACRGYDERLRYWGFMETDLALRLEMDHEVIDLAKRIGCDFFHLSHGARSLGSTRRTKNPRRRPSRFAPNDADWGLADHPLDSLQGSTASECDHSTARARPTDLLRVLGEWRWQLFCGALRLVRGTLIGNRISEGGAT